jgi:hypothetical protein
MNFKIWIRAKLEDKKEFGELALGKCFTGLSHYSKAHQIYQVVILDQEIRPNRYFFVHSVTFDQHISKI